MSAGDGGTKGIHNILEKERRKNMNNSPITNMPGEYVKKKKKEKNMSRRNGVYAVASRNSSSDAPWQWGGAEPKNKYDIIKRRSPLITRFL